LRCQGFLHIYAVVNQLSSHRTRGGYNQLTFIFLKKNMLFLVLFVFLTK
jgi:hypothetical protein